MCYKTGSGSQNQIISNAINKAKLLKFINKKKDNNLTFQTFEKFA